MNYAKRKERARLRAIDWQQLCAYVKFSYSEIAGAQERFRKLGKRYGLSREFKKNGII